MNKSYKQLKLFIEEKPKETEKKNNKVNILFRNTVSEIPSTTYGTFAIYRYPAKFIPQVVAFILEEIR